MPFTPPTTPKVVQLWRLTSIGFDGNEHTITFEWRGEEGLRTENIDPAAMKSKANLSAGPTRPNLIGATLFELSEDDGQTWRTVFDERTRYTGY